jgi:hypothetical protein
MGWRYRSRGFGVSPGLCQAIDQKALKGAPAHVPHLPERLGSRPEKTNDFSFLDLPTVRSRGHRPSSHNVLYLLEKFRPAFRLLYWCFASKSTRQSAAFGADLPSMQMRPSGGGIPVN